MAVKNRTASIAGRPRRRRAATVHASQQHTRGVATRRRRLAPLRSRRPPRQTIRQRLHRAARLHIDAKLRNGLQLFIDIGPAWLGLVISIVVAAWWPQLLPALRPLLRLL